MIALVVTIVVLLILSAVAIGLSVGDNGIITSARNATDRWEQGATNEQDELKQIANFINNNGSSNNNENGGNENPPEETPTKISDIVGGAKFEQTETIEDDNGKEVTIPKDFSIAEDSNTVVDEGIVITDGTNEFVWVPVDDPSTMFVEETVKLNGVETTTTIYSKLRIGSKDSYTAGKPGNTSAVREPDVLSKHDTSSSYYKTILGFNSTKEMADSMVAEYKAMSDSIKKYHGFYIGRYELTGTVDNPTESAGEVLTSSLTKAQSWYGLYKACKNVIKDNSNVRSTMIYGCQWDETMTWLNNNGYNTDTNSSSWGSYRGSSYIETGNQKYKANEIYDMAGNYWEWTQEARSSGNRVIRGGGYYYTGSSNHASHRFSALSSLDRDYASRATLYILY